MEYIYGALLLHSAGKEINEDSVKKVLEAAGVEVDEAKVKALVSSLEGVNIDEVLSKAAVPVTAAPAPSESGGKEEQKEEKKEDEEKKVEEAAEGLASLFG